ncbi:hypothetical protein Tco_1039213 [Tanacetum coccineum]
MSLSLAKNVIVAGADNRPPMLDKTNYSSWASHEEKLRESVDITATNIVLQGSELSLQERESKLYDDFDIFTSKPGETVHSYYMRFSQLINDIHTIALAIQQSSSLELDSRLVVPSFNPSDDPIANLNKLMAFEIPTPAAFQTDDLDTFDSDCDDVPSAKAVLMANLSSYDSDVLSETHVALFVTDTEETLELAEKNKKYFEIEKKELSLDNDRLLEHIICQDIMNTVTHANDHYDIVLPANNNSLDHDNSALDLLKHENDRLMELLISQDLVHTAVNSLTAINDYKSMQ